MTNTLAYYSTEEVLQKFNSTLDKKLYKRGLNQRRFCRQIWNETGGENNSEGLMTLIATWRNDIQQRDTLKSDTEQSDV